MNRIIVYTLFLFSSLAFAFDGLSFFTKIDQDLISLQRSERKSLSVEQLQQRNSELIHSLASDLSGLGITKNEATDVFNSMKTHPVISDEASLKYDTEFSQTGFCFGRAAYFHWELLSRGVRPEHLAKIFVVGRLVNDSFPWDFHVVTVVKNKEGGWLVLDPLQTEVKDIREWPVGLKPYSSAKESALNRYYLTDANKFLPVSGAYTAKDLKNKIYRGFFIDLYQWFLKSHKRATVKFIDDIFKSN